MYKQARPGLGLQKADSDELLVARPFELNDTRYAFHHRDQAASYPIYSADQLHNESPAAENAHLIIFQLLSSQIPGERLTRG